MPEPGAVGTGQAPPPAKGSRSSRVIVFAGPCLPPDPAPAWRRLLERVDLRPPARRGDVLAAVAEAPRALVLLDGYYYTVPSVTHKELLYALDAGVRVVGAASMGALRAVELAPHGMVGVGRIFEWFAEGTLDGDDEVALLHGPAEEGYPPLTLALVEVRWALESLVGTGEVDADGAGDLVAAVKALPFTRRHPARIVELAREHLGTGGAGALVRALAAESLKAADARLALEATLDEEARGNPPGVGAGSRGSTPPPCGNGGELPVTLFLNAFREESVRAGTGGHGAPAPTLLETWWTAAALHPGAPDFVHRLRLRYLLASSATAAGIPAQPARVDELSEQIRQILHARQGGPVLPFRELREEAGLQARAEAATVRLGGPGPALAVLARSLGLAPELAGEELFALLETGFAPMPSWCLARAFLLTPAFPAATATTRSAAEIHRCFRRWSGSRGITVASLNRTAAALWSCRLDRVPHEAHRRALADGTFRPTLELLAPAEGLKEAINDYPEVRRTLPSRALQGPLESPAVEATSPTQPTAGRFLLDLRSPCDLASGESIL